MLLICSICYVFRYQVLILQRAPHKVKPYHVSFSNVTTTHLILLNTLGNSKFQETGKIKYTIFFWAGLSVKWNQLSIGHTLSYWQPTKRSNCSRRWWPQNNQLTVTELQEKNVYNMLFRMLIYPANAFSAINW